LRVLSKLAPDDLCAFSLVSRAMHTAAEAPELWAAHVRQRWGGGANGGDDEAGASPRDWRAAYFERDALELREQLERGGGGAVAALLARAGVSSAASLVGRSKQKTPEKPSNQPTNQPTPDHRPLPKRNSQLADGAAL
jgi:hypothetical protein